MASPTLSGKHSHRGAWQTSFLSGHCLIVAHPFWREPRAPVLLLEQAGACDQQKSVYPCSYFLGRGYLAWNKPNGARIVDPPLGAGGNRRIGNPRSMACGFVTRMLQQGLVLGDTGAAGAARSIGFCNSGLHLWLHASRMLAVRLGSGTIQIRSLALALWT
jgi:hypothetical protein